MANECNIILELLNRLTVRINITIGNEQHTLHQSNPNDASIQLYADHDPFSLNNNILNTHSQQDIQTKWVRKNVCECALSLLCVSIALFIFYKLFSSFHILRNRNHCFKYSVDLVAKNYQVYSVVLIIFHFSALNVCLMQSPSSVVIFNVLVMACCCYC